MTTLRQAGELETLRRLARLLPAGADVETGIGDDCAVVRLAPGAGEDLLLTSDPVTEGVHFTAETAPARIGHKALGRALSDIAAMGGTPRWALVDVVAPADARLEILEGVYGGMQALAALHGLAIVGGDLSQGPALSLHVFVAGAVPRGAALLRSGARTGDLLCVTGSLGGSRAGKHLDFAPRLAEGRALLHRASACMDVSDGLASDLRRMAEASRARLRLRAAAVPVSAAARAAASAGGPNPLTRALCDGEDFELLFAIAPQTEESLAATWRAAGLTPYTVIGEATAGSPGVVCVGEDGRERELDERGYLHFGND